VTPWQIRESVPLRTVKHQQPLAASESIRALDIRSSKGLPVGSLTARNWEDGGSQWHHLQARQPPRGHYRVDWSSLHDTVPLDLAWPLSQHHHHA
jgi:hypothetical protein